MAEKSANQNLNTNNTLGNSVQAIHAALTNELLAQFGRNVTFWLEPGKTPATNNPDQYNSFFRQQDRRVATPSDGNKGHAVEIITVTYKAHIVHGPKMIDDGQPVELKEGELQLSTVIGALDDINLAIELEIDGIRYQKHTRPPRPIGLQAATQLMSWWSRKQDG